MPDEQRSLRAHFVILAFSFAAVTAWAVVDDVQVRRPWKRVQDLAPAGVQATTPPGTVSQLVVPELGVVDRCPTCHMGIEDPAMTGPDIPAVMRVHSDFDTLLRAHPTDRFGCTPCHGGQGLALTAETAHGEGDPDWPDPMLRGVFAQARCLACHAEPEELAHGPELGRGAELFGEMGCDGCHATKGDGPPARVGPPLLHVGRKLRPEVLQAWIARPGERSRGLRMPRFWPDAEQDDRMAALEREESRALAAWLIAEAKPLPGAAEAPDADDERAASGRRLFDRLGCRGCHVVGGEGLDDLLIAPPGRDPAAAGDDDPWDAFDEEEEEPEEPAELPAIDFGPPLGDVGSRLQPEYLVVWLLEPATLRPHTVMPDLRLEPGEAADVAAFLGTLRGAEAPDSGGQAPDPEDEALVKQGRELAERYGCHGCHDLPGFEVGTRPGPDLVGYGDKKTSSLYFGDGWPADRPRSWEAYTEEKLRAPRRLSGADVRPTMPSFSLSDDEVRGLRIYLRGLREWKAPADYVFASAEPWRRRAEELLRTRNCRGCHALDERGSDIGRYYAETYLGPPTLVGEGERVQPQWALDFLLAPRALRPWLDVRMPSFGLTPAEAGDLVRYFVDAAGHDSVLRPLHIAPISVERAAAGARFFDKLKCVTCHLLDNRLGLAADKLAPDLGLSRQRLVPAWVRRFLLEPAAAMPGTNMPQFFPGGQTPDKELLGGDVDAQLDLLVDYLMNLGLQPVGRAVAPVAPPADGQEETP